MSDDRFGKTAKPPAETGMQEGLPPPADAGGLILPEGPTDEERTMAVLCHVGGFLASFIVPLVLWLVKRRDSAFVDRHGKEALNLQLFFILVCLVDVVAFAVALGVLVATENLSAVSFWICVGASIDFVLLLGLYEAVVVLLASIAAWRGRPFRFPITIRFIR